MHEATAFCFGLLLLVVPDPRHPLADWMVVVVCVVVVVGGVVGWWGERLVVGRTTWPAYSRPLDRSYYHGSAIASEYHSAAGARR
jgi:hypothetical protein